MTTNDHKSINESLVEKMSDTNESFQAMNSNMPKATKLVETLITSYIPNDVIAN
jgi:hypothetical protein